MNTLTFLLSTVIELYTMVLLLRVWMQWARCDFYNPFSQFVVKITQPIIGPLRRIIPPMGPIDSASLLVAFILSVIKAIVLFKVITFQAIIWIAAVLILLKTIGLLIFWVLLVMAIMSWVSQGRSPIEYVLIQLAEPLLSPIRRILPAMGGIDFSPMVLVLLLYVVNMGSLKSYKRQATCCCRGCGWRYECCDSLRRRSGVTALYSAESQPRQYCGLTWRRGESRHYRPAG